MELNILHVSRQFLPAVGGIENVVRNLSCHQVLQGHHVKIVTLNRIWDQREILPADDRIDGIEIKRIPFWGSSHYAFAPRVLSQVRGYDLIHLHSSDFFLDFLSFTRSIHHIPIIFHTHGLFFHSSFASAFKRVYLKSITRVALAGVRAIICDSSHDQNLLNGLVPQKKINLIPNGINFQNFAVKQQPRQSNLILSVGRLSRNKRYPLLLQAFQYVQARLPHTHLVIIGKDQGEKAGLEALAERLGIASNVHLLGEITEHALIDYFQKAPVWASASEYESFGISLLESMAAGCVPVVQHLEAYDDFFQSGISGFYANFSNPKDAGEMLVKALTMPEDSRVALTSAARRIARFYDWQEITSQVSRVYQNVLEEGT